MIPLDELWTIDDKLFKNSSQMNKMKGYDILKKSCTSKRWFC